MIHSADGDAGVHPVQVTPPGLANMRFGHPNAARSFSSACTAHISLVILFLCLCKHCVNAGAMLEFGQPVALAYEACLRGNSRGMSAVCFARIFFSVQYIVDMLVLFILFNVETPNFYFWRNRGGMLTYICKKLGA